MIQKVSIVRGWLFSVRVLSRTHRSLSGAQRNMIKLNTSQFRVFAEFSHESIVYLLKLCRVCSILFQMPLNSSTKKQKWRKHLKPMQDKTESTQTYVDNQTKAEVKTKGMAVTTLGTVLISSTGIRSGIKPFKNDSVLRARSSAESREATEIGRDNEASSDLLRQHRPTFSTAPARILQTLPYPGVEQMLKTSQFEMGLRVCATCVSNSREAV